MPAVESTMFPLGKQAPSFELVNVTDGKTVRLEDVKSDIATVIMFICNHCPFVKHVQQELVRLANDYQPKGITFIAINSNDVEKYPDDSPENMKKVAEELGYPFPYLFDETQEVAKAYQAACTPDFYVFDGDLKCVYRGQLDDSRPNNGIPVTGESIRAALDALLNNEPVPTQQKPSIGCSIKWKES
ncbi:thioredoxin family protein [Thermaerobacillus caldiproteolyticus]|uniref:Peroxiredoxin n=1 Tax=Thermaerobacillus caldiproteolyticus TaxID=247480 RepID=A0A7V9Z7E9_9BACL|nr:thioredoxin family protein [Anoxybacillus caldiproteolyticus]MBA2875325.1 peroxiredoxin [Anoxybacillus caldiproteolyticus]QPA33138.1 thioredoxin family protein [Anoxybacillus caldiproteolyticus]